MWSLSRLEFAINVTLCFQVDFRHTWGSICKCVVNLRDRSASKERSVCAWQAATSAVVKGIGSPAEVSALCPTQAEGRA